MKDSDEKHLYLVIQATCLKIEVSNFPLCNVSHLKVIYFPACHVMHQKENMESKTNCMRACVYCMSWILLDLKLKLKKQLLDFLDLFILLFGLF